MRVRHKSCPICTDSTIRDSAFKGIAEPNISFFLGKWNEPNKYFLTYNKCTKCELLFVEKYFNNDDLNRLYTTLEDNNFIGHETSYQLTQKEYANFIRRKIENKNGPVRILEIGPDIGTIARILTDTCDVERYDVIEGNSSVHKFLRDIKNLNVYNKIEDLEQFPQSEYDVIVMIHVLDHIFEFPDFLKSVAQKLKPSGALITCTHDSSSVLARIMGRFWPPICAHHPQIFSRPALRTELSKNFERVEITKSYNYVDISFPLRYFLNRFGLPRMDTLNSKIVKIRLGNIIGCSEGPKK